MTDYIITAHTALCFQVSEVGEGVINSAITCPFRLQTTVCLECWITLSGIYI